MSGNNVALLCVSLLLLVPLVVSDDDYTGPSAADIEVFNIVNDYRTKIANVSALGDNRGAACVAHGVAFKFKDTACNNETGADAPFGENLQIPDYPALLNDCDVDLENVKSGQILPNCVPAGALPAVAAMNITNDQRYQAMLNDSTYKTGGVGSSGVWYVLVLATDQPDGNFGTTKDLTSGQDTLQMSVCISLGVLFLSMFLALYR